MKKMFSLMLICLITVTIFAVTIYEIQYTTDPSGDSPFEDQIVTVTGIVTATGYYASYNDRFFISEPEGGAWNGIYIFHSDEGIQIGDEVEVTGTVTEYYNFTEINYATVSVISSGNPVPSPVEITTNDLATEEMYESVLVKINNITVAQSYDGYGQWYVDDGSGQCQIDNQIYTYSNPQIGDYFSSIVGVVDYSFDEFGLNPRTEEDFIHLSFDDMVFGSDATFDIMTWNLENFPKNGETTIDFVVDIILSLDVDFIALQEIENVVSFYDLKNALNGWDGHRANSASFNLNLAYLYKTEEITINSTYELFTDNSYYYPRFPLVADINWNDSNFLIIDNHLKAENDQESENRRRIACNGLKQYIDQNCSDMNVILLGDLNDSLTDPEESNVFQCFLDDEENYEFADMIIASGNSSDWSMPSSAHFDHILITNELFNIFNDLDSQVNTIKVDMYMEGGWDEYDENISNHRPVALKLDVYDNVDVNKNIIISQNPNFLRNYPNPFNPTTTIFFSIPNESDVEITVFNIKGQKVKSLVKDSFESGNHSVVWNSKDDTGKSVSSGVYFFKLNLNGVTNQIRKCILISI